MPVDPEGLEVHAVEDADMAAQGVSLGTFRINGFDDG
jgi:hypothetical protein